jgi:DNA-binding transcriptional LysR family regulator
MPVVGYFARALRAAHPDISLAVRSLTSREIELGLAGFELDAGITYLDHEPPAQVLAAPLYAERGMFVARTGTDLDSQTSIAWQDAVTQPLCLLHEGMQNRRILDAHLSAIGMAVHPLATADSYVALFAMVEAGGFCTIVPEGYAALIPGDSWAHIMPFKEPFAASRVGLVILDRSPTSQLAQAAIGAAHGLTLPPSFAPLIDAAY